MTTTKAASKPSTRRKAVDLLDYLAQHPEGVITDDVVTYMNAHTKSLGPKLATARNTLAEAGINPDEAYIRKGHSPRTWYPGPRLPQARYVLDLADRFSDLSKACDPELLRDVSADGDQPRLTLRALYVTLNLAYFPGGLAQLQKEVDKVKLEPDHPTARVSLAEIHAYAVSPRPAEREYPIPAAFGEDGLYVRGHLDYADESDWDHLLPRIRNGPVSAALCDAFWVERHLRPIDVTAQVEAARAQYLKNLHTEVPGPLHGWTPAAQKDSYRYVRNLFFGVMPGALYTPPLDLRPRAWYDVDAFLPDDRPLRLHQEGLRNDHQRTALRALVAWYNQEPGKRLLEGVRIQSVSLSKLQPRPGCPS